jgi:hypothetical protein
MAVSAIVISGHFGLLMLLLQGGSASWPDWPGRIASPRNIIKLRFIETAPARPNTHHPPVAAAAPGPGPPRRWRTPVVTRSAAMADHLPTAAPSARLISGPDAAIAAPPGSIPGGNLLRGADLDRSSSIRLPGSSVAIVPGLQLVDPRTQGVAGAARLLQHLFGVPDTHCVEVDAWRTLSAKEMLARHISPAQVQKTAEEYGCLPKA